MSSLQECVAWYGEEAGGRIHAHWQDVRKRIRESPTVIIIPPRDYAMEIRLMAQKMTREDIESALKELNKALGNK